MTSSFRFKASRSDLSTQDVAALRRISPYSIGEIKRRALSQQSLLDIPVFSGEWPASKADVVALLEGIEAADLPVSVCYVEASAGLQEHETALTVEAARERLRYLEEISFEQDVQGQLEAGHASYPEG